MFYQSNHIRKLSGANLTPLPADRFKFFTGFAGFAKKIYKKQASLIFGEINSGSPGKNISAGDSLVFCKAFISDLVSRMFGRLKILSILHLFMFSRFVKTL